MLFFGHTIKEIDVVDSTNNYLIRKSRTNILYEGEVVFAHYQTEGKGQRETVWESLPGKNLMFSIYTTPTFLTHKTFFLISKAIAIAVKKTVENICYNENIEVKWPNDIYVNNKKIGGILIENQYKGDEIKQSIIGVGLNVNQLLFDNKNATSLRLTTSKNFNVKDVLLQILQNFEKYYLELKQNKINNIDSIYLDSLMNYELEKTYKINNQKIKGTITDVKNNGILVLETKNKTFKLQFKEIEYII